MSERKKTNVSLTKRAMLEHYLLFFLQNTHAVFMSKAHWQFEFLLQIFVSLMPWVL